jgi:hypothetical protein
VKTNWTRQWWGRIHATLVWRRFRDRAISRVRRRSTRDWAKRMGLALLEPLEARAMLAADVATDRFDYPPGSTALITTFSDGNPGADFQVGETVQFLVARTDGLADAAPGNRPWLVTDGVAGFAPYANDSGVRIAPDLDGLADGRITTDWFVEGQYVNASLEIRATGLASGAVAIEQFLRDPHRHHADIARPLHRRRHDHDRPRRHADDRPRQGCDVRRHDQWRGLPHEDRRWHAHALGHEHLHWHDAGGPGDSRAREPEGALRLDV